MDVYSLWESLRRIFTYLGDNDTEALEAAENAFRCFEPYGEDPQRYAWATRLVPAACESAVIELLIEMHRIRLGRRYDAFCFFDDTKALAPLQIEDIQKPQALEAPR